MMFEIYYTYVNADRWLAWGTSLVEADSIEKAIDKFERLMTSFVLANLTGIRMSEIRNKGTTSKRVPLPVTHLTGPLIARHKETT